MGQANSTIHPAILRGIEQCHRRLMIEEPSIGVMFDRSSVEYLVRFLRQRRSRHINELYFGFFRLAQPSDGGGDVLQSFFASDRTLTKVTLFRCDFGSAQDTGMLLLAALYRNSSITELEILEISNQRDNVTLGTCLAELLQNNAHLQKLRLQSPINVSQVVRAMRPGLQANRQLKELSLSCCGLGDEGGGGLRLIVDELVGTTLQSLDISDNRITSIGLSYFPRLLESTQLKEISFAGNNRILEDNNATQHFANVLARNKRLQTLKIGGIFSEVTLGDATICQALESNTTLRNLFLGSLCHNIIGEIFGGELGDVRDCRIVIDQLVESIPKMKGLKKLTLYGWHYCPQHAAFLPELHRNTSLQGLPRYDSALVREQVATVHNILARNCILANVDSLLLTASRRKVVCGMALVKLASVTGHGENHGTSYIGTSAIFKILQARPTLMRRQKRAPLGTTHPHQQDSLFIYHSPTTLTIATCTLATYLVVSAAVCFRKRR